MSPSGRKSSGKSANAGARAYKEHLKAPFLNAFRKLRSIGMAAEKVGTTQRTVKRWRDADPEFAETFEELDANVTDSLKSSTLSRAIDGVPVDGYLDKKLGEWVVTKREYSDRMAELHLKQRDPSFRERVEVTTVLKVADVVLAEIIQVAQRVLPAAVRESFVKEIERIAEEKAS